MSKLSVALALGGAMLIALPQAAAAQMGAPNGAEITGHSVQVNAGGVTNTVYFDPGGSARILSAGGREVQGQWFIENQNLCLATGGGARECWPYQQAFVAGQPMTMTSSCGTSQWTAVSTAQPMMAPPPVRQGERG